MRGVAQRETGVHGHGRGSLWFDDRTLTALHLGAAVGLALFAFFVLRLPDLRDALPHPGERATFVRGIPIAGLLASLIAIGLGASLQQQRRMLRLDALTWPAVVVAMAIALWLPLPQPFAGLTFAGFVAVRFAPLIWRFVCDAERGLRLAFALTAAMYTAFAIWTVGAVQAGGDPVHYLIATEALARATLDLTAVYAGPLFHSLTALAVTQLDITIHTVPVDGELRLAQGYLFPAAILPGWLLAGRTGATIVVALIGALAAAQTFQLMRETVGDRRLVRLAWALFALTWPFAALATHVYPEALAALVAVVMFRLLFTAPVRRPLLAGALATIVLLLVPRHALVPLLLLPFVWRDRAAGLRYTAGLGAAALISGAVNGLTFGVPVPYAGYLAGVGTYGETFSTRLDIALFGMLFDRAFGLAGSAPWVFIGAIGIVPLLRTRARWVVAALVVVLGARLALSSFRLWEGGWGPPNRYIIDVLPLWMPFVAAGLAHARAPIVAVTVGILLLLSAGMTTIYAANPGLAYSSGANRVVKIFKPYVPFIPQALLPSFTREPERAHQRSAIASLVVIGLVAAGWHASRPRRPIGTDRPVGNGRPAG